VTEGPLVSIVTCVLNGADYLEESIKSVLDQLYQPVEHIIVDGGSTDGTVEMLSRFAEAYPGRVRFISEPDRGACDAWNKGWSLAKGDVLGWLGGDDVLLPDAIQSVVGFFGSHPETFFVYGGCEYIDTYGQVTGMIQPRDFSLPYALNNDNPIPTMSAFYRREVIERVGLLDTTINACDYDYWLRVGKVFPLVRIDKVLSQFRIHPKSIEGSVRTFKVYAKERYILNRRHGGSLFSYHVLGYVLTRILPTPIANSLIRAAWELKKGRLSMRRKLEHEKAL
jgi:glycosyltransferase involved in cell wall biosynthesis